MKGTNKMEWDMDRVNFTTKMEECTMETGSKTKWKVTENSSINQVLHFINAGKIAYEGQWVQDQFTGQGILYN